MKYKYGNPSSYVEDIYNQSTAEKSVVDMVIQLDDNEEIRAYMSVIEQRYAQYAIFIDAFRTAFPTDKSLTKHRTEYYELMGGKEKVEQMYRGGALDEDASEYYREEYGIDM
nr:hypothetical protein [uncultured Mediterranean phage uvMED]